MSSAISLVITVAEVKYTPSKQQAAALLQFLIRYVMRSRQKYYQKYTHIPHIVLANLTSSFHRQLISKWLSMGLRTKGISSLTSASKKI